jgi:phosphate:Na+ symporter
MIIQSSDATIGILQALAISVSVNFRMAVVIVCGAQIGTCITAILSSVGSGKNAKRAALIHLYYNLIKNVPFITVLLILDSVTTLPFMSSTISTAGIALFHSSINLLFSLILLPVSGFLVKLAVKTIPYTEQEKQEQSDTLQYLDPLLFRNPGLAVAQARKAVSAVSGSVRESYRAWLNEDSGAAAQYRERSARYLRQTEAYMRELTEKRLLEDVSKEIRYLQQICGDFSIINDQVNQLLQIREASSTFSKATADDLKLCGEAVR